MTLQQTAQVKVEVRRGRRTSFAVLSLPSLRVWTAKDFSRFLCVPLWRIYALTRKTSLVPPPRLRGRRLLFDSRCLSFAEWLLFQFGHYGFNGKVKIITNQEGFHEQKRND